MVGTDYFTKWVETEPLANIRDVDIKKFVWKNIVTRFEIPYSLISDNGLQFHSKYFRRYYCELGITNNILLRLIPKGTNKLKLLTRS